MKESKPTVFICHASEDKESIVRPIMDAFKKADIPFWIDEDYIGWGESIIQKVNEGLNSSTYLLVILSMHFQKKNWPMREFYSMLNDENTYGIIKVLPLIVGTDSEKDEIIRHNRLICDKKYLIWTGSPDPIVKETLKLLSLDRDQSSPPLSRVCFISSEFPPNLLGGLGVHVDNLATSLGSYIDVDVVLPFHNKYDISKPGVHPRPMAKVRPDYSDPISWLYFAHHVPEKIRSIGIPDVIHCHDWVTILGGIKSKWLYKIPLIFHIHLPNRSPLCASIENLGLICADLITVNSQAMREELLDRIPTLRIEVIPNGVDTKIFTPASGKMLDDEYLLFVGRLVEQKGVEYLLRAMSFIKKEFPSIHLKIVGEGPLRPALENFSSNFLLSDQVEFLGWKNGNALIELYQNSRLVVVPSIYEPFGMTALEAMACGKSVVASRVGGLQSIVVHGDNGYLAESRDYLDLAQWIMALLSTPELCSQMGEKALQFARDQNFQWSSIACKYIEFYNMLLREELDFCINPETEKYKNQITSVAVEIAPELGVKPTKLIDSLFSWMVN